MSIISKIFLAVTAFILLLIFLDKINIFPNQQKKQSKKEDPVILSGKFNNSLLKSAEEWKKILTPDQYHILREKGTEIPFTGALNSEKRPGTYYSYGCAIPVFHSEQKFDSGTGWPSFTAPINPDSIVLAQDNNLAGQIRIEVLDKCGGHLGHVFDDGPPPAGKRYCINSAALYFIPDYPNQK